MSLKKLSTFQVKRSARVSPSLDMTPLIDVVFLLIIFFMLSSSFILQPGIKVNLPESSVQDPQKEKSIEITVTQENFIFFNAERISLDELKLKLKSYGKSSPNTVVVIKADGNVRHHLVVEIMATAKENQLHRLAIATRPKKES